MGEKLVLKGQGNVDVQIGGPGRAWGYLSAFATMSGPSIPTGATEIRWMQDPRRANQFRISSKFKTSPDQISADITLRLGSHDHLKGLDCPFTLRARYTDCGEREDPGNWDPIMLVYCDVDMSDYSYDDLVITDGSNQDEIMITVPWQAAYEMRVEKVSVGRVGQAADAGDQPANDVVVCDTKSCGGNCGARSDGCSIVYYVTDSDTSPYAAPNFVKVVKDNFTDAYTWTVSPILGLNGNAEGVECRGSRIWVSSNSDSAIAYNDEGGDQDEWNIIALGQAPAARHTALFARTAREIWVAAAGGYVYKSVDGGASFQGMHEATVTSEDLYAVWAYDEDLVYASGANGVIIKSTDGGQSWKNITDTSTTSATILNIVVPEERPEEVYIGTNNGKIYRSHFAGERDDDISPWTTVTFDGEGVGTIDGLYFAGPCAGEIMWIVHNDGGPRGRVLRDLSGGNGGADVERTVGYTDLTNAGVQINALGVCNHNQAFAVGENVTSYPMIARIA